MLEKNNLTRLYITLLFFALIKFLLIPLLPYSTDEIRTLDLMSTHFSLSSTLAAIKAYDTQMPLFYLWAYFFKYINLIRIPQVVLMGVTVFLPFLLGLKSKKWMVFSLLLVTSYFNFRHAVNFRPYALFYFGSVLYVCGLELFKEGQIRRGRLMIFSALFLMLFTHYYALLVLGCFYLHELFSKKPYLKERWLTYLLFLSLVILIPFLDDIVADFNVVHTYRLPPTILDFLKALVLQLNGGIGSLYVLGLAFIFHKEFLKVCHANLEYLYYIVLSFIIAYLKSWLSSPAFNGTYFIFLSPFVFLILSQFILELKRPVIFLSLFIGLSLFFNYRDFTQRMNVYNDGIIPASSAK